MSGTLHRIVLMLVYPTTIIASRAILHQASGPHIAIPIVVRHSLPSRKPHARLD